jgi:subtilisin
MPASRFHQKHLPLDHSSNRRSAIFSRRRRWFAKCQTVPSSVLALVVSLLLGATIIHPAASFSAPVPPTGSTNQGPPAPAEPEKFPTADNRHVTASDEEFERFLALAERGGSVRTIIGLQVQFTPEGALTPEQASAQRAAILTQGEAVTTALEGSELQLIGRYEEVPYIAFSLTAPALEALRRSGKAASLSEDRLTYPTLNDTIPLIEGNEAHAVSRRGTGQYIAVLDTGISSNHSFLQTFNPSTSLGPNPAVQACFSTNGNVNNYSHTYSVCPNHQSMQIGSPASEPCTFHPACDHGTHVAGIAAGRTNIACVPGTCPVRPETGVAPDAKLIGVQVFSHLKLEVPDVPVAETRLAAWTTDLIKGLNWVYSLRNSHPIAAANMSLGDQSLHTTDCGSEPIESSIANLRSAGIPTTVSSGNQGLANGVSYPACAPSAITVGATTKGPNETVWGLSNHSQQVELLAPGHNVNSSVPGGGFAVKSGTSMAAPHVAGAWAVMRGVTPNTPQTVAHVLQQLQDTGKPIPNNIVTRSRIRLLSASVRLSDTGFRTTSFIGPAANVVSQGVSLVNGNGNISVTVPAGATILRSSLYWMTVGGPDSSAILNGQSVGGALVGASRDTCWNINQMGPNRTYRAQVTAVPGVNTVSVSGVGASGGVEAQGASLVIVYRLATGQPGRVVLREGALTGNYLGEIVQHTFSLPTIPSTTSAAELHVGFADGEAASETQLFLNNTALTGLDPISGSDGVRWDDKTMPVQVSTLAPTMNNRITVIGDCLAWGYSALTYR